MKRFIKNCMLDNSDEREFRFSAVCTDCGEEYRSTPVLFSKYALPPPTEEKRIILRRLYEREHEQALQQAVSDAVSHFNVCPICGRLVCNNCFVICDDLDMCRTCADYLQETGETVSAGAQHERAGWEPAFAPPPALQKLLDKLK
ncbi:MAG: hypothetical protein IJP01_01455 [Oscillospiraceae bacterium]|nr:hypothetical protein [Oscillospiraceae bacterium]